METEMDEGDLTTEGTTWDYELDMSQLCRICGNPNEYLIPIFQGEGVEHQLKTKINKHLPIEVLESDKLSTNLCYQCASTLIAWHDMVVGCLEADEKLRTLIDVGKNESGLNEVTKQTNSDVYTDKVSPPPVENNADLEASPALLSISETQKVEVVEEQEIKSIFTEENDKLVIERVLSPLESELIKEVSAESSEVILVKPKELQEIISVPMDEDNIAAVEVYEDVETSVIIHDYVEDFSNCQYIAFVDENIESSVEVVNQETEDVIDSREDTKPYICEECGKVFMNIPTFKSHLNMHQNRHFCSYCDAHYKRIDHLNKHIEIMHPHVSSTQGSVEKKINPYAKTFLCNTCGKILKSSIAYENHTLKHQSKCPYPCSICTETFPNRGARRRHEVKEHNLLTKENGNPDGYHVCEICGIEMFSDGAYYHHKDKHGDPYPCGFCGKLYGSRSLMQVHARRHTNERPFVCSICNRNFKVKQELNAHMNIHKDLRPYKCPHCPKMCRKSSDLTHHIRTHTGEKPYICDKCGRGFAQAGDMRKHRQLHFRPSKLNKNIAAL